MPRTPSAFPFSGRLRRRAINPTPPKRVKDWGNGPLRPEVMYPVAEHHQTNSAASNHSRSRAPHHRTQSKRRASDICCSPHRTGKYGTRPFCGGSGCRAVAHAHPAGSKNALGPVGIPLFGAPQASGNKPNPPEGGKSLGGRISSKFASKEPAYERWKRACWYDESAVTHSSSRVNIKFFDKKWV